MSNQRRANLLFLSGLVYSASSVIFMGIKVLNNSNICLRLSVLSFALMTFSLIFSMNFNTTEYDQLSPWVFRVSFLLLIPLWIISTVLTFIVDVCLEIFPALERDEGGDDKYGE